MNTIAVLGVVAVADIERAIAYYERLLGRPFDERPMRAAAEWKLSSGGSIQVVHDPERAGKSMITIGIGDADALVRDLATRDIRAEVASPGGDFRLVQIKDVDGNQLTFAEDQRRSVHHVKFPGESAEYRAARNVLLEEERALRVQIERVAEHRRALPPGGIVKEDYVFEVEGGKKKKLSELFPKGKDTLAIYSFMYGPDRKEPCPGCTHFLDGLDGSTQHILQRIGFVVVAKSPIERIQKLASERGWSNLVFASTAGNTFDRDYYGDSLGLTPELRKQQDFKDGKEWDMPMLNVFKKESDGDGRVRHFWGCELLWVPMEKGQEYRHNDLLDPVWNMFDVTPEGRGDFHPKVRYDQ